MLFKFLGNKRLLILLFSLIFFTIVMGLTLGGRAKLTWPEMFLKDTVSWMQSLIYQPSRHVAGFFEDVTRLHVLYVENKALKLSLSQYARDVAKLNGLEAENERLREMLKFEQSQATQYSLRVAEVVARSPDRWNNTITIDLGSKQGIKPDMAVITPQGLIGRVQSVSLLFSNVQLVSDIEHGSRISAVALTKPQPSFGIIEGFEPDRGYLIMKKIQLQDPIKTGDYVVTSGLGEVFPKGLTVGQVVEVKKGEYGLSKTALIKPAADLYHLSEVFVVERSLIIDQPASANGDNP